MLPLVGSRNLVFEISLENLSLTSRWTLERPLKVFSPAGGGGSNGGIKSLLDKKTPTFLVTVRDAVVKDTSLQPTLAALMGMSLASQVFVHKPPKSIGQIKILT